MFDTGHFNWTAAVTFFLGGIVADDLRKDIDWMFDNQITKTLLFILIAYCLLENIFLSIIFGVLIAGVRTCVHGLNGDGHCDRDDYVSEKCEKPHIA